jgi:hypothetical protein
MTKNGLGYILGDFFTNASGHPVRQSKNKLTPILFHFLFDVSSA